MLIAHIIIALANLLIAAGLVFKPTAKLFKVIYGLTGATFISGLYLVISRHSRLLTACFSGLIYLGIIAVLVGSAKFRLARAQELI